MKIFKTANYKKMAQVEVSNQELFDKSLKKNGGDVNKAAKFVLDMVTGGTWAVWDQNKIENAISKIIEKFTDPMNIQKCNFCGKTKPLDYFRYDNECEECSESEEEEQRAGRAFMDSGEYQNYPEFDN